MKRRMSQSTLDESTPTPPTTTTAKKKIYEARYTAVATGTTRTPTIKIRRTVVKERPGTTRNSKHGRI